TFGAPSPVRRGFPPAPAVCAWLIRPGYWRAFRWAVCVPKIQGTNRGEDVQRRQVDGETERTEGEFAVLDVLPHPSFVVAVDGDDEFRFTYANAASRALLGPGRDVDGDLSTVLPAPALVSHVRGFARAARERRVVSFESEWAGGPRHRAVSVEVRPLGDDDGSCTHIVGAAHEITDRRALERELEHRAKHDPLTELPNRVMLLEWLDDAIARLDDGYGVGLVLLDIDHFKVVNDSLGHDAGDELLALAAKRVQNVLRAGDKLARLGGDELAIVAHDVRRPEDVLTL